MCSFPYTLPGLASFMIQTPSLFILALMGAVIIEIVLLCNKDVARRVPINYYLLFAFTLCESYGVAFACLRYEPEIIFTAVCMTTGAVGGLTFYAYHSKTDFSYCVGFLYILGSTVAMATIMMFFFYSKPMIIWVSILCVFIFSIFLLIDTQRILGNAQYALSSEDYITGAMLLYIDIIALFLEILRILGRARD